jgi:hypothetical protein
MADGSRLSHPIWPPRILSSEALNRRFTEAVARFPMDRCCASCYKTRLYSLTDETGSSRARTPEGANGRGANRDVGSPQHGHVGHRRSSGRSARELVRASSRAGGTPFHGARRGSRRWPIADPLDLRSVLLRRVSAGVAASPCCGICEGPRCPSFASSGYRAHRDVAQAARKVESFDYRDRVGMRSRSRA